MPCCKKHKALISKYKAHILKYMPCIFRLFKHLKRNNLQKTTFLTSKIVFGDIRKSSFLQKSARQADMSFNSTHRGITKNSVNMFFRQIRRN